MFQYFNKKASGDGIYAVKLQTHGAILPTSEALELGAAFVRQLDVWLQATGNKVVSAEPATPSEKGEAQVVVVCADATMKELEAYFTAARLVTGAALLGRRDPENADPSKKYVEISVRLSPSLASAGPVSPKIKEAFKQKLGFDDADFLMMAPPFRDTRFGHNVYTAVVVAEKGLLFGTRKKNFKHPDIVRVSDYDAPPPINFKSGALPPWGKDRI